jgi:hypothetical protein
MKTHKNTTKSTQAMATQAIETTVIGFTRTRNGAVMAVNTANLPLFVNSQQEGRELSALIGQPVIFAAKQLPDWTDKDGKRHAGKIVYDRIQIAMDFSALPETSARAAAEADEEVDF